MTGDEAEAELRRSRTEIEERIGTEENEACEGREVEVQSIESLLGVEVA